MPDGDLDKQTQPSSIQPLKIGLIGIGNMGQHHARVLSLLKNVKLVGIADVNVEQGLEAASKYKARYYEDYRELIVPSSVAPGHCPLVGQHKVLLGMSVMCCGKSRVWSRWSVDTGLVL